MSLKEAIERELHFPTRIRLGAPGSLDIFAGGKKIFSKKQEGRVPTAPQIIDLLRREAAL